MFTGQHKQRSRKIKLVLDGHVPTPHENLELKHGDISARKTWNKSETLDKLE